jgi:hypothetical protein
LVAGAYGGPLADLIAKTATVAALKGGREGEPDRPPPEDADRAAEHRRPYHALILSSPAIATESGTAYLREVEPASPTSATKNA